MRRASGQQWEKKAAAAAANDSHSSTSARGGCSSWQLLWLFKMTQRGSRD
jgi:hypothetical protein